MKIKKVNPVQKDDVILKLGSGSSLKDKVRGKYWHIYVGNERVGKIYIDYLDNPIIGLHPSIDIFINQKYQGRKIGTFAYEKACAESGLKEVYMHTRKSNIASIKAARDAGFEEWHHPEFRQVVMRWTKGGSR